MQIIVFINNQEYKAWKIQSKAYVLHKSVHLFTGLEDKWACINILKHEVIIDKSKNMGSKIIPPKVSGNVCRLD